MPIIFFSNFIFFTQILKAKPSSVAEAAERLNARFNFIYYIERSEDKLQNEGHEKRLQSLRKVLTDIKDTEWQYDPIEKYIGQS